MRKLSIIALLVLLLAGGWWLGQRDQSEAAPAVGASVEASPKPVTGRAQLPAFLPAEAHDTLALIASGGPFPYPQDGSEFGNRERHLPAKPRGYYREYTVYTPGIGHRGARRIVTGGRPPEVFYYTDDHYDSFRSFKAAR